MSEDGTVGDTGPEGERGEAGEVHPNRDLVNLKADECASEDADFKGITVLEGWDDCILGTLPFKNAFKIVYSTRKIIEGLEKDMSHEEAVEYFDYNIGCLYTGEYGPILLDDEYFE